MASLCLSVLALLASVQVTVTSGSSDNSCSTTTTASCDSKVVTLADVKTELERMSELYNQMNTLMSAMNSNLMSLAKSNAANTKAFTSKLSCLASDVADVKTKVTEIDNLNSLISNNGDKLDRILNTSRLTQDEAKRHEAKATDAREKQQMALDYHTSKLDSLSQCFCRKVKVFHLRHPDGYYKFTFEQAKAACQAKGAVLATPIQLETAWKMGYEMCACGWLSDRSARYPMHFAYPGCGGNRPGITTCSYQLNDAYCI